MFFSIVVPVYNVNLALLSECIESIVSQSFTDYELILVDDGSTDASGKLCDEYAKKTDRIHVIHKKNGGVSSARNAGLAVAQGDWLMFCDADDTFEPDSLEKIQQQISKNNYSLYKFHYEILSVDGSRQQVPNVLSEQELPAVEFIKLLLRHKVVGSCWGYAYRTAIAKKLAFNEEIHIGEDTSFVVNYLSKTSGNVFVSPLVVYDYRTTPGSVSKDWDKISNEINDVNAYIKLLLVRNSVFEFCKTEYNTSVVQNFVYTNLWLKRVPSKHNQLFLINIGDDYYKADVDSIFNHYIHLLQVCRFIGNTFLRLYYAKISFNTSLAGIINRINHRS